MAVQQMATQTCADVLQVPTFLWAKGRVASVTAITALDPSVNGLVSVSLMLFVEMLALTMQCCIVLTKALAMIFPPSPVRCTSSL